MSFGLGGEVVPGAQAQLDWREEGDHSHDPFTCFATSMELAMWDLSAFGTVLAIGYLVDAVLRTLQRAHKLHQIRN